MVFCFQNFTFCNEKLIPPFDSTILKGLFLTFLDKSISEESDWIFNVVNQTLNGTNGSNVFVGISESFVLTVLHLKSISFCSVQGPQSQQRLEVSNIKGLGRTEISRYKWIRLSLNISYHHFY